MNPLEIFFALMLTKATIFHSRPTQNLLKKCFQGTPSIFSLLPSRRKVVSVAFDGHLERFHSLQKYSEVASDKTISIVPLDLDLVTHRYNYFSMS
jgi:hypothetical protein